MGTIATQRAMQTLLLISSLAFVWSVPLSQDLTPSWVNICGGAYLFSEDTKSWNDAYGECELYGSHIAQIDGFEENFCLLEYAHTKGLPAGWYWHSGNDILSEGVWRQYDEQMILWSPWWENGGGGGNGGRGQNCALLNLDEGAYAGEWADNPCTSDVWHYICERDQ